MSEPEVYVNGRFVPYAQATVHVEDRGFLFADGVYEVVRVYGGRFFALDDHMARLERSAALMRLPLPPVEEVRRTIVATWQRSGLSDAAVYLEITRGGPYPRTHGFPTESEPTVVAWARPPHERPAEVRAHGAHAITVADKRWHMCQVKSVGLFLNCLAKQQASDAGVEDAIFVRPGGIVTEASSSNFAAVFNGELHTHPEGDLILPGITRKHVLDLARREGIPVIEEAFTLDQLKSADEAVIMGTTTEVLPVVRIDDWAVGGGAIGPIARRLAEVFGRHVRSAD